MNIESYNNLIKKLYGTKDITGKFNFFDKNDDTTISHFKLLFILPNGKCLFMPYPTENDYEEISGEYEHLAYLVKAIELILEEFGIDRYKFIQEKLNSNNLDDLYYELIANILSLHISFFYDLNEIDSDYNNVRLAWFNKSPKLSEKQEDTLIKMMESLKDENYGLGIQTLNSDCDLNIKARDIVMRIHGVNIKLKEILGKDDNPLNINDFYKIINVDLEQIR